MATVNTVHKNYSMLKKKSFNLKLRASIMSKMNSYCYTYGIKIQIAMFLTNLCGNETFAMKGVIATVCLASHLDRILLPDFCDENVFRIVLDILLRFPNECKNLLPILGK